MLHEGDTIYLTEFGKVKIEKINKRKKTITIFIPFKGKKDISQLQYLEQRRKLERA